MTDKFYDVLFDKGEWTCFTDDVRGRSLYSARTKGRKEECEYFSINPLHKGTTRAGANVSQFRNMLIEIDKDANGNKIPRAEQEMMIAKLSIPYATMVWSGGKSYHCIISLSEPFEDSVEYKQAVAAVYRVLRKSGFPNDEQVKDPARLSRAAGALRVNTKQIQEVFSVKGRITRKEFDTWLAIHDEKVEEPVYYDGPQVTSSNPKATEEEIIEWVEKYYMKNHAPYESGNYNYQFALACNLIRAGMQPESIKRYYMRKWNHIHENKPVEGAASTVKPGEYIWVPTKEERIAYAKSQEVEVSIDLVSQETVDFLTAEKTHDSNEFCKYFRVGTKFYRRLDDGTHVLWDKQTINDDFGKGAHLRIPDEFKYVDFTNQPNYMREVRKIAGKYNLFQKPKWEPTPGEWPTIEKLLRKVFQGVGEDQYEVGLDYIQLLWTQPKQKLRILVVASKGQETGKDTFLEFMRALFTPANATIITAPDFESPYNSHFASKHIIMVNEVKFSNMVKGIKDKIKNYATQEKVHLNGKNEKITEIDYWGRLIMATNHINDFVEMDDEDKRYWVREMPPLLSTDKDPHFQDKINKEIPHFLHFMLNRELWRKSKAGRFWHSDEECDTEATRNVKKNSKSNLYNEIYELLEAEFNELANGEEVIYIKAKSIQQRLKEYKLKSVTMCLRDNFGFEDHKQMRPEHFTGKILNTNMFEIPRSYFEGQQEMEVQLPWYN